MNVNQPSTVIETKIGMIFMHSSVIWGDIWATTLALLVFQKMNHVKVTLMVIVILTGMMFLSFWKTGVEIQTIDLAQRVREIIR